MKIGKLSNELLNKLILDTLPKITNSDIILGAKEGEDCSAIRSGDDVIVLSTDPISGATKDMGYLAVTINSNDIATSGAIPIAILITILLPPEAKTDIIEEIMNGAKVAATELGIQIIGGHTEITDAVNRPLVSATAIGKVNFGSFLPTGSAKGGQDIVMTKYAGIEGTYILANENQKIVEEKLGAETLREALALFKKISILKEAKIASSFSNVAMHDVTEGGLLGATYELSVASGVGVEIFFDAIPVLDVTKKICELFCTDFLKLISSGSLLIATDNGSELTNKLIMAGINSAVIGKVTDGPPMISKNGKKIRIDEPEIDMLYSALERFK